MASPNQQKIEDTASLAGNRKITELKKKILLAEGQKKAYHEEWEEQKRNYNDKITDLRKEVKDLRNKLTYIHNPNSKKNQKLVHEIKKKVVLPPGARTAEEGVQVMDLKNIDIRKQIDRCQAKYAKRQEHFRKLVEEYQTLQTYKNDKINGDINTNPPETVEEDANRKLITQLENEIHRTSVQWMEAEHIRKKYRGIKASLLNDSEKFESALLELEHSLTEQQAEITKLEDFHKEAIQMRETTKSILQRQEQTTNFSYKARERQAQEFRRQVEERKLELERLERKIFSSGKTMVHQESIGSGSGDHPNDKAEVEDDANVKETSNVMEKTFKKLMESTGTTAASELVDRFLSQREATSRLTYLRSITEAEKKELEIQREAMNAQLESFKFADIKESDVNQEELERVKGKIEEYKQKKEEYAAAVENTAKVVDFIKDSLIELLLKLQEIDENAEMHTKKKGDRNTDLSDIISGNISSDQMFKMLEEKIKLGMLASGQLVTDADSGVSDEDTDTELKTTDELVVPISSPSVGTSNEEREKPPAYPPVYFNLISGRTTTQISSASPGQSNPTVPSEDEGDVPSRNYLKRQAQLIVDSKSRRKGFRAPAPRRK